MKKIILLLFFLQAGIVFSHPGSGILVDKKGNIYFTYTGVGVGRISNDGALTYIYKSVEGHWLCLDAEGIFSQLQPKYFKRITEDGVKPALIFAGGGSPVTMGNDGNFYYCGSGNADFNPGAMTIIRETQQHNLTVLSPQLEDVLKNLHDGITGLAADASGLYVACWNSLLRVNMKGDVKVLVHPVNVPGCDEDPADHKEDNRGIPLLRGIATDRGGNVYVAATSCHCLIMVTPDGKVKTVLTSDRPWSPTGVTVDSDDIYVLEYTNANGPKTEGWKPRIRKIDKDGNITVVLDLSKDGNKVK